MRGMLFHAHSGLRYLVLLAGILAVGYLGYAAATRRTAGRVGRILAAAFTGLLDLQVLLGLLLLASIPFYGALAGHIVIMIVAALVMHGASIGHKRRPPERQGPALLLVGVVVALALILLGILSIGRPILGSGA